MGKITRTYEIQLRYTFTVEFEIEPEPDLPADEVYYVSFKVFQDGEELARGTIKAGGCSHWWFTGEDGYVHICGPEDLKLFQTVFQIAASLLKKNLGDSYAEALPAIDAYLLQEPTPKL